MACAYQNDQLNRIQQMRSYHRAGNAWARMSNDRGLWDTEYDFDKNGNIERLHRRKPDLSAGLASVGMDRLTYHYNLVSGKKVDNKLGYVSDAVQQLPGLDPTDDIQDQNPANYTYNAIEEPASKQVMDR